MQYLTKLLSGNINIYGDIFSKVYDLFWNEFIENIGPYIFDFTKNKKINKILDLCCGTGRLAKIFLEKGYEVVGIDKSKFMIAIAENRNKKYLDKSAKFIIDNATSFNLETRFELVISTYDSINHLRDLTELKQCFQLVNKHLTANGYFIFDINTVYGLRKWNFVDVDDNEKATFIMIGKQDPKDKIAYTKVMGFLKDENNKYDKFEEVMTNSLFEMEDVIRLLEEANFTKIHFRTEENFSELDKLPPKTERIFVITQKL